MSEITNETPLAQLAIARPSSEASDNAMGWLAMMREAVVDSPEQYTATARDLAAIKARYNAIEAERKNLKAPIIAAGKAVDAFFAGPLSFLESAEKIAKGKLVEFSQQQERERIERQRIADELAEKERQRLKKIADDAERKALARASALRADAQAAIDEGNAELAAKLGVRAANVLSKAELKADALNETAAMIVAPIAETETPKVGGLSNRVKWCWVPTDVDEVPRAYMMLDDAAISGVVRALKGKTQIPGIRVYAEPIVASGSK